MKNLSTAGKADSAYSHPGEIDLVDLMVTIIMLIEKHVKTIVILVIIGILCALGIYLKQPDEYQTTLIFSTPSIPSYEVEQLFHAINRNLKSGNTTSPDLEYGLNPQTIKHLTVTESTTPDKTGSYRVEAIGYSKTFGSELALQLAGILSSRNKKASQEEKIALERKLEVLSTEIRKLEGISIGGGANNATPQSADHDKLGNLLRIKLEMIKERLDLELKHEKISQEIQVRCLDKSGTPIEKSLIRHMLFGFGISLLISFLVVASKELNRLVRMRKGVKTTPQGIEIKRALNYN
jgi:hypothetical protein